MKYEEADDKAGKPVCIEQRSKDAVEDNQSSCHIKSLKDFGYHFDEDGVMRDEDGKGFVFTNQKSYEAIGEAVTEEIYRILEQSPYNLCRTYFGKSDKIDEKGFIFHSKDFDKKKYLMVLIHGSGVVRAGQWARRLIMNESLDRGSQLPYLRECAKRGWGVLLMNTNHNTFIDTNGHRKALKGSGSAVEHGITVWRQFIKSSKADCIAVVAHSAGGMVISNIIKERSCWPEGNEKKAHIGCVCLTDSFFEASSFERLSGRIRPRVRHWIAYPSEQIGAPLPSPAENVECSYVECVTAGTNIHEETSAVAIHDIFKYIEKIFKEFSSQKEK